MQETRPLALARMRFPANAVVCLSQSELSTKGAGWARVEAPSYTNFSLKTRLAAKRRKNAAHDASRGLCAEFKASPEGGERNGTTQTPKDVAAFPNNYGGAGKLECPEI